jgi:hypothetical protein
MTQQNIIELIDMRCTELGWSEAEFLERMESRKRGKAARRLAEIRAGNWEFSASFLEKLPAVLNILDSDVVRAVDKSRDQIFRVVREQWRAQFSPGAFIVTNPDRPRQITMCGLAGGSRYREISLAGIAESDYLVHAFQQLYDKERMFKLRCFFDNPVALRINQSFDLSKTYDLHGKLLSTEDYSVPQGAAIVCL